MILVTGGCGFIGANLVRRLVQEGQTVRVLDNLSTGKPSALQGLPVELLEGDIRNMPDVRKALSGVTRVVHLAAQTGIDLSLKSPETDLAINISGTLNLLAACAEAGARQFILASSNAVTGGGRMPVDENQLTRPISPYGASKLAAESYCHAYANCFGLQPVILRFANVYGPGSTHKQSVVASLCKEIIDHQTVTIYGDGSQTRDFIYVGDIASAIVAALSYQHEGCEIFQIASGVETPVLQLATLLIELSKQPGTTVRHLPPRPGDIPRNYSNIEKARHLLKWAPAVSLADGLQQTVEWFNQVYSGNSTHT